MSPLRTAVLDALAEHGPLSTRELAKVLSRNRDGVATAVRDLWTQTALLSRDYRWNGASKNNEYFYRIADADAPPKPVTATGKRIVQSAIESQPSLALVWHPMAQDITEPAQAVTA